MLKKATSLLICAVVLLASAPAKAFAQTVAQPAPVDNGGGASDAQAKRKPELKTAISGLLAKSRAATAAPSDMKRFERERPQNTAKGGMTRKEKILIYSIVAGMVVLAVVLGIKTGKGGHAFCDTDPTDPDCLGSY
jgi:hypothetical protein